MSDDLDDLRAILAPDDEALLRAIGMGSGKALGQRCREAGLPNDRRGVAIAHQRMLYMERQGLVCRMDTIKPVIWLRTPKGSAELVTRDAEKSPNRQLDGMRA